jgi:hypothetical protein
MFHERRIAVVKSLSTAKGFRLNGGGALYMSKVNGFNAIIDDNNVILFRPADHPFKKKYGVSFNKIESFDVYRGKLSVVCRSTEDRRALLVWSEEREYFASEGDIVSWHMTDEGALFVVGHPPTRGIRNTVVAPGDEIGTDFAEVQHASWVQRKIFRLCRNESGIQGRPTSILTWGNDRLYQGHDLIASPEVFNGKPFFYNHATKAAVWGEERPALPNYLLSDQRPNIVQRAGSGGYLYIAHFSEDPAFETVRWGSNEYGQHGLVCRIIGTYEGSPLFLTGVRTRSGECLPTNAYVGKSSCMEFNGYVLDAHAWGKRLYLHIQNHHRDDDQEHRFGQHAMRCLGVQSYAYDEIFSVGARQSKFCFGARRGEELFFVTT